MIRHYVTIDYGPSNSFTARCTCGEFNKKYPSRDATFSFSHLHIAGMDVDLLELALAGKDPRA